MAMRYNPITGRFDMTLNGHNYLYLPGRAGGQTANGGTVSGDNLILHSNTFKDGKIYLDDYSAYDEATSKIGFGVTSPAQRVDIGYGNLRFTKIQSAGACTSALAGLGAGNLSNGAYLYKITYVTDEGETDLIEATASNSTTVVNKTVNGQIALSNIPVSSNIYIISKKIYRTKVGGSLYFYLDTISNATTTYIDNTADTGLYATDSNAIGNTTAGYIYVNTIKSALLSNSNNFFGYRSLISLTTGYFNTAIGYNIMPNLTTGYRNFAAGYQSMTGMISGYNNVAIGYQALYTSTTGYNNYAAGYLSLYSNTSGYANFAMGSNSMQYNQNGYENIGIGVQALQYNVGGTRSVGIGSAALQNTHATGNTGIGYQAGLINNTGTYNTYLGYSAGATGLSNLTKSVAIGYNAKVEASNTMALGGTGVDVVNIAIGKTTANHRMELFDGNISFISITAPTECTPNLAGLGAGNLSNGAYYYKITFRHSSGETNLGTTSSVVTVIDKTVNGQVSLTNIPVGDAGANITSRRIYRTKAGGSVYYLVDTINDNTSTTYTDNIADADLISINGENAANRDNTIKGRIYKDGYKVAYFGGGNTAVGRQALESLDGGFSNVAFGPGALYTLSSGSYNVGIGSSSGYKITSGVHNMFIGTYCGYNATTGSYNIAVGNWALGGAALTTYGQVGIGTSSLRNNNANGTVAIGYQSGYYPANILANASVTDTWCTYLGAYTGNSNTTPLTGAVAIGYYATVGANYTIALGGTGSYASKVVIGATTANATLDVRGSIATAVAVKTGNYTLTANDHTVKFTTTATATLPAATGTGIIYVIIAENATVTVDANGSETINGELTQTLIDGESMQIQDMSTGVWNVL